VFEDNKGIIRIRKSKKERQQIGQKKKYKERQHNGQKKKVQGETAQWPKEKVQGETAQWPKEKVQGETAQWPKEKVQRDKQRSKKIHIQLSNIIFTYLRKPFIFTFVFLFEKKILCYYSYIVGVNFIGEGNTSTKRKTPTCHKIVGVEYGTIVI
jgi:hypothetical protein